MITLAIILSTAASLLALIRARHDGPSCQCARCQTHRERQT